MKVQLNKDPSGRYLGLDTRWKLNENNMELQNRLSKKMMVEAISTNSSMILKCYLPNVIMKSRFYANTEEIHQATMQQFVASLCELGYPKSIKGKVYKLMRQKQWERTGIG